eukprot:TRINITY_DN2714_c0_g1_i1.p1 TRINITY_DN2714_c0_g1~~TRINITY_DN2714_c0_g1_i1.p1  ORF type:complete len:538 (-),score=109.28 TRINITY_DN2714_c0_g1_i1:478-2091(-)
MASGFEPIEGLCVRNTFLEEVKTNGISEDRCKSDSEVIGRTNSETPDENLHLSFRTPGGKRSESPAKESSTGWEEVEDVPNTTQDMKEKAPMDLAESVEADASSVRKRRPGKREREQLRRSMSPKSLKTCTDEPSEGFDASSTSLHSHDSVTHRQGGPSSSRGFGLERDATESRQSFAFTWKNLLIIIIMLIFLSLSITVYLPMLAGMCGHLAAEASEGWRAAKATDAAEVQNASEAAERQLAAEAERRHAAEASDKQRRHDAIMLKPAADLLQSIQAEGHLETRNQTPDAVLSKLDNEKFQIQTGAWKFKCKVSNLEASMRAKLNASVLPIKVVNSIIDTVKFDEEAATQDRKFDVDGEDVRGLVYQYRLRKSESDGVASVALTVSSTTFDMKKVVDHYEEQEEPVFEFVPNPSSVKKVKKCKATATTGQGCILPFRYKGVLYDRCTSADSSYLWCATGVSADGRILDKRACGDEMCFEEEIKVGPRYYKKLVDKLKKKFPVYSKRALPEGVSQSDLALAIESVTAREALKVLKSS